MICFNQGGLRHPSALSSFFILTLPIYSFRIITSGHVDTRCKQKHMVHGNDYSHYASYTLDTQ